MTADPQRQTCKACGRPDKFDFHVPDAVWTAVVPVEFQGRVLCLFCFDEFARAGAVDYAGSIDTLYFAGDRATMIFRLESASHVDH